MWPIPSDHDFQFRDVTLHDGDRFDQDMDAFRARESAEIQDSRLLGFASRLANLQVDAVIHDEGFFARQVVEEDIGPTTGTHGDDLSVRIYQWHDPAL